MTTLRSTLLGFSIMACIGGWGPPVHGQSLSADVLDNLAQLDRAVCWQQWERAIDITGTLIASSAVSVTYRQELLMFRQQLELWRGNPPLSESNASCDRTRPLVLVLDEPPAASPQPLNWARAFANVSNPRPIVELNGEDESTLIPPELLQNSPEVLAELASPIDTADSFNVVGGRADRSPQTHSFLARVGDRVSLDVDVTRVYAGGDHSQLFLFDHTGRLLSHNDDDGVGLQSSLQNTVIPETAVYFAVIGGEETQPIFNSAGILLDWQVLGDTNFDYTLTLTGVTPYQALLP